MEKNDNKLIFDLIETNMFPEEAMEFNFIKKIKSTDNYDIIKSFSIFTAFSIILADYFYNTFLLGFLFSTITIAFIIFILLIFLDILKKLYKNKKVYSKINKICKDNKINKHEEFTKHLINEMKNSNIDLNFDLFYEYSKNDYKSLEILFFNEFCLDLNKDYILNSKYMNEIHNMYNNPYFNKSIRN